MVSTPWNILVSWDYNSQSMETYIMFQTTNQNIRIIQTYQRPCKMLTRDVSNMFKHQSNCSKKIFHIQTTPSLQTTPSAWFMYPSTHAGVPVKRRMFIFGWFSRVYQYIYIIYTYTYIYIYDSYNCIYTYSHIAFPIQQKFLASQCFTCQCHSAIQISWDCYKPPISQPEVQTMPGG